jgi:hypothetical protein
MQTSLIIPGHTIAQKYLIHQRLQVPESLGETYLAQYHDDWYLLESCPVPEIWTPEDLLGLMQEILRPWDRLRHGQVQKSYGVILDQGNLVWVREQVVGQSCRELLQPAWAAEDIKILLQEMLGILGAVQGQGLVHGGIGLEAIVLRESDGAPVLVGWDALVRRRFANLFADLEDSAPVPTQDLRDLAIVMAQLLTGQVRDSRLPEDLDLELLRVLRSMRRRNQSQSAMSLAKRLGLGGDWRERAMPWLLLLFGAVVLLGIWRMVGFVKPGQLAGQVATMPMSQPKADVEEVVPNAFQETLGKALGIDRPKLKDVMAHLTEEARTGMGSYYRRDYERWLAQLSPLAINQNTVEVLTDTQFFWQFPSLRGKALNPRTLGQIWYAMAHDQIENLGVKKTLTIVPNQSQFKDRKTLTIAQGKVYQIKLEAQQSLELKLSVSQGDPRISIVHGELFLARYTGDRTWSVPKVSSSKTYQIIITPSNQDSTEYELTLSRN